MNLNNFYSENSCDLHIINGTDSIVWLFPLLLPFITKQEQELYNHTGHSLVIDTDFVKSVYELLLNEFVEPDLITKQNLMDLAVFKNFRNREDLINLIDSNSNLTFEQLKEQLQEVDRNYNSNWLKTELDLVKKSSMTNQDFIKFTEDGVKYLKFNTQQDERVRPKHRVLQGIIRQITDPFWRTNSPPLAYNCRCYLTPANEPTNIINKKDNPMFDNNVFYTKIVFTEDHPYFNEVDTAVHNELIILSDNLFKQVNPD